MVKWRSSLAEARRLPVASITLALRLSPVYLRIRSPATSARERVSILEEDSGSSELII